MGRLPGAARARRRRVRRGTCGGLYGYQSSGGVQRFFRSLSQYDQWTPAASTAGEFFNFVSIAGTNPTDAADALQISSSSVVGDSLSVSPQNTSERALAISWRSKADRYYVVEASADLAHWSVVSDPIIGTGGALSHQQAFGEGQKLFLRVRAFPLLVESIP